MWAQTFSGETVTGWRCEARARPQPEGIITCVVLISGTKAFLSYIISKQHATKKIHDLF